MIQPGIELQIGQVGRVFANGQGDRGSICLLCFLLKINKEATNLFVFTWIFSH